MKKIIKLKVISAFFDINLGSKRLKNQIFECDEERAKILLGHPKDMVEILEIKKQNYASNEII